jgi:hypothetical protein
MPLKVFADPPKRRRVEVPIIWALLPVPDRPAVVVMAVPEVQVLAYKWQVPIVED